MLKSDWSVTYAWFLRVEERLFGKKIVVDLSLDERRIPGKLSCICSYGVQMRNEHTDKHSSLHIWVYPWDLYHFCGKVFYFILIVYTLKKIGFLQNLKKVLTLGTPSDPFLVL